MNLTEERVNEILDDLIERGLVVEHGSDIELSPPFAEAVARTVGESPEARVRKAASEVGFQFPFCCVAEYEMVLARLVTEAGR